MKQLNFYRDPKSGSHSILVGIGVLILALSGCATTEGDDANGSAGSGDAAAGTGSEFSDAGATAGAEGSDDAAEGASMAAVEWTDPGLVHFDFDRAEIRSDAVAVLQAAANQLKASDTKVVVAGHCDNRGSEEYNLALGDRRAAAVKRYLVNLGVSAGQLLTVSYGELRPLRRDNNADAWAENRRAEFAVAP